MEKNITEEQTIEYFKFLENGNLEYREILINRYIDYVKKIINLNFFNYQMKDELLGYGIIGLIKAIDNFDYTRNIHFKTFATKCIKNEIGMFIRRNKKHLDNPTFNVYIDEHGIEVKVVEELVSTPNFNLSQKIEDDIEKLMIYKCLDTLNEIEKRIILLKYGFINDKIYNQMEISEIVGLSQSYISRIISKSLEKLKSEYFKLDEGKKYVKVIDKK